MYMIFLPLSKREITVCLSIVYLLSVYLIVCFVYLFVCLCLFPACPTVCL